MSKNKRSKSIIKVSKNKIYKGQKMKKKCQKLQHIIYYKI